MVLKSSIGTNDKIFGRLQTLSHSETLSPTLSFPPLWIEGLSELGISIVCHDYDTTTIKGLWIGKR